nr:MAG TPA: hypothetical protein [Caudoviricetes sp.]
MNHFCETTKMISEYSTNLGCYNFRFFVSSFSF